MQSSGMFYSQPSPYQHQHLFTKTVKTIVIFGDKKNALLLQNTTSSECQILFVRVALLYPIWQTMYTLGTAGVHVQMVYTCAQRVNKHKGIIRL